MKHVCIVFLVILCLFLCSCKGEKYQCDLCKAWYDDGQCRNYLVPEINVDVMLCPDCYQQQPTAEDVVN